MFKSLSNNLPCILLLYNLSISVELLNYNESVVMYNTINVNVYFNLKYIYKTFTIIIK